MGGLSAPAVGAESSCLRACPSHFPRCNSIPGRVEPFLPPSSGQPVPPRRLPQPPPCSPRPARKALPLAAGFLSADLPPAVLPVWTPPGPVPSALRPLTQVRGSAEAASPSPRRRPFRVRPGLGETLQAPAVKSFNPRVLLRLLLLASSLGPGAAPTLRSALRKQGNAVSAPGSTIRSARVASPARTRSWQRTFSLPDPLHLTGFFSAQSLEETRTSPSLSIPGGSRDICC